MCGRYTLKSQVDIIAETFGVQVPVVIPPEIFET